MNNIIISKNNFGKVLDKFYYIVNSDKTIVINYELKSNKGQTKLNNFLKEIQKNPIKSNLDPLTFQQNARNEWK